MDPYRASRAERSSALLKSLGNRAFWNASVSTPQKPLPEGSRSMKKLFSVLIAAVLAAQVTHALAETSPVGSWQFASYHVPGGGFYANQTICFKADNTWYSSSQAGWNGAWFQNGEDLQWNGSVPMPGAGSANNLATIAMGKLVVAGSMSGNYAEWAAPSTLPLSWDRHYTYTMTYKGATCAAPK